MMDHRTVILLMLAVCAGFIAYLLYTRQFKWLLGVIKNAVVGCAAIFGLNWLLASTGIAVGLNVATALVVGVLGLPGFLLLYASRWIL